MHVHVNIIRPLPPSWDFSYVLTVVDRTMRPSLYLASPLKTVLLPFVMAGWHSLVICCISHLTTSTFHLIPVESHGCHPWYLSPTTSYHPQSNELVKHFHRSLETVPHACLAGLDWFEHLPWMLRALSCTPKEDLSASLAALIYHNLHLLPSVLLSPQPPPEIPLQFAPSHHAPS